MIDLSAIFEQILENWTLVFLFSFFVFNALFVFRPGSRVVHEDAAQVPFRTREDAPALDETICPAACAGCASCAAAINQKELK
jgi:cytochrome c oxidase cbb3-type subunit 4